MRLPQLLRARRGRLAPLPTHRGAPTIAIDAGAGVMRITHVISQNQRRGAETVAANLATVLERRGIASQIVALRDGHPGWELPGIVSLGSGRGLLGWLFAVRRLRATVQGFGPEVIVAHGSLAAFAAALAFPTRATPLVWHRILELPGRVMRPPANLPWVILSQRVDAIVSITERVELEVQRFGYRHALWRLPNHRPWATFERLDRSDARARLRTELGLDPEARVVGFVGFLYPQKQPGQFVAVAQHLAGWYPDAHFVMAGDGPLAQRVAADVAEAGLTGRLTMLGARGDVAELLAGLDLLLITSLVETMAGVLIEAHMAGCPVITYPLDGADEVVLQDRTGVVLDTADSLLMAEAARRLLDTERFGSMSDQARCRGRKFSTETVADDYVRLLQGLISTRSPSQRP